MINQHGISVTGLAIGAAMTAALLVIAANAVGNSTRHMANTRMHEQASEQVLSMVQTIQGIGQLSVSTGSQPACEKFQGNGEMALQCARPDGSQITHKLWVGLSPSINYS